MKLVSMISAFVLVIGMLLIGVFAVERVQVDMGGSITFNADDVYARVTGNVTKAQVAPEGLDVTYSAYETTGNPTAWESLDLEFDSYATPIVISITVENLSTERSLTVNLTDALTSSVPNLGKALQRDNGTYTSGSNITLDPNGNATDTTTFTITLSVTDKNQSLTNAQFDYDLNLYDESYKFPEVYDYFTFSDNGDGTVTLTDFNESLADGKTDIVIPATVSQNADGQWIDGDGYTVVSIVDGYYYDAQNFPMEGVFLRNTTITSVVLPDTIEYIGECAFAECSSLTSITLPESLTSIGIAAFQGCSNLQPSKTDDNGVKYLGSEQNPYLVLWDGTGITNSSYTVNPDCKIICPSAFSGCDVLTSITLPEGITSIGDYAFSNCDSLTTVDLDQCTSLTSIGDYAFSNCDSLTTVELDQCTSLTSIGGGAFSYCSGLTSITLPESLTSIGDGAFSNCRSLTPSITDDNGVKYLGNEQNPYLVLWGGKDITSSSYTVNPDCKIICFGAFTGCDSLTSIILPEGITSIGNKAFSRCSGLTSITLPSSLTSIGSHAFDSCDGLTSIDLSNCTSLTSIEQGAFSSCSNLTSITLPESLTSIGNFAFDGCDSLKEVVIDSEYVYTNATSTSACGYLFGNSSITTVKVLTSLDDGTNSYITANFTKGENDVIGEKSYTVYSK